MKKDEIEILKEHFVNGTTITVIVKNTGLSRYEVEKIIGKCRKASLSGINIKTSSGASHP